VRPADRDRIAELLQDPSLSYRAIGRQLGISDWTIRRVARELDGDCRPMKQQRCRPEESIEEPSAFSSWLISGIVAAGLALAIWAGARWAPPEL
jgi:hypothetical protein